MNRTLASAGSVTGSFWRPSRGPTSTTVARGLTSISASGWPARTSSPAATCTAATVPAAGADTASSIFIASSSSSTWPAADLVAGRDQHPCHRARHRRLQRPGRRRPLPPAAVVAGQPVGPAAVERQVALDDQPRPVGRRAERVPDVVAARRRRRPAAPAPAAATTRGRRSRWWRCRCESRVVERPAQEAEVGGDAQHHRLGQRRRPCRSTQASRSSAWAISFASSGS